MSRTDPEQSNQSDEAAPTIERGWITVSMAAKYAGLSADTLRRAIWAGELEAYEKPVTYPERRTKDERRRHIHWITKRDFVDAWLMSQPTPKDVWEKYWGPKI